jgi:hypothetical protein
MPTVSETIPAALQTDVDAALAWFNRDQAIPFEVTGILDPDDALEHESPRELRLVLCGGDRCEQRSFRVANTGSGREIGFFEDATEADAADSNEKQAELDPPPGPRRSWLDRTLDQHDFTVVLFYRGFW